MNPRTLRAASANRVASALRRITQAIRLSSATVQGTLGITGAQLFVLQQLTEDPQTTLGELARRTLTDPSTVSGVVSRLVDGGHLVRRTSTKDARRVHLSLTARGRAVVRRAPELAQTRLIDALQRVRLDNLRVTASVLGTLAHAMDASSERPPMFFEPATVKRARARHRA